MPPTTQNNTDSQNFAGMDMAAINMARAIRQTESGGNYNAVGKSGETGAYQWTAPTWKEHANQILGDPNAPMTQANQNAVAYGVIKSWKDEGLNAAEIAAKWNSGSPTDWQNKVGTNAQGVHYDVPAYVKSVTDAYQTIKAGGSVGTDPNNPSSIGNTTITSPYSGTLGTNPNDSLVGKFLDNSVTRTIQNIFPGQKIGQDIGTLGGYIGTKLGDLIHGTNNASQYDLSAPTPLQAVGDVAQGALMVGAGLPEESAVGVFGKTIPTLAEPITTTGRIARNVALGTGFGFTGALANGSTKPSDILKQTAFGGALGGAAGIAGEVASNLAEKVPQRIVNNLLPQLKNPDTINYAIDNLKLGSVDSMVSTSQKALDSYGKQIDSILAHPDLSSIKVSGADILSKTLDQFPNSEYSVDSIISKLKSQVPSEAATITRLQKGNINLEEANALRQAIDKTTYKLKIDSPEVKAGKELASSFANALRNEVQTQAPETAPIFKNFSKEINLQKALIKLQAKTGTKGVLSMKELLGALGASGLFGPVGAATTIAAEKVASTPLVRVGTAKAIKSLAPAIEGASTVGKFAGAVAGKTPIVKKK